jgi:hypothetical protein
MTATGSDRQPYIGADEDGCRRSAEIDREEADALSWGSERKEELYASAERWDEQAHRAVLERVGPRPSLAQLRAGVGSEEWLTALALLDLPPVVADDAARYTEWSQGGGRFTYAGEGDDRVSTFHPDAEMDWEAWVNDVDQAGRGWSSSEARLYELVTALTVSGRKVALVGVLDQLGSWERQALDILIQWASGGNNREYPGRLTVAEVQS